MIPKAFIFDLDGTLVDTEELWAEAISQYLADGGATATADEVVQVVFGHSWLDIHSDLRRLYPKAVPASAAQTALELRPYYLRLRTDPRRIIIESSVAALKRLAKLAPAIIVSGSPHCDVEAAVDLIDARSEIRFVLGAEDYRRGKPAPDGFLSGAQRLGVPPADCVVFEDSPSGVASAKAAGMRCVALDRNGFCTEQLQTADLVVPSLEDYRPTESPQVFP
ncbi:MAG: HAD family phosphatase [Kiritimatiellae bacterium]|nr:HAD family phosphatase [Kiritimatiellia bacterium]